MQYRGAEPADADAIASLHTQSWRRTYRGNFPDHFLDGDLLSNRREVWRARLDCSTNDQFVCVAADGAQLAGFLCAYGYEDPEWGCLIDNLHVSEDYARSGIGAALMRRAGNWLASTYGRRRVYLWVWEKNEVAKRFYEGLGGENAGTIERQNNSGESSRNCRYVWSGPDVLAHSRAS